MGIKSIQHGRSGYRQALLRSLGVNHNPKAHSRLVRCVPYKLPDRRRVMTNATKEHCSVRLE